MHLLEIGKGLDPEFHLGAAIAVVSLFVLSGAGAGAARSLDLDAWQTALVILVSSTAVLIEGAIVADRELKEILDLDLTPPWTIELVAMVAVIVGLVLVTPYAGWRAGHRAITGHSPYSRDRSGSRSRTRCR